MTWKRKILVVANVTAASEELIDELTRRCARDGTQITLVVPATPFGGGRAAAEAKLEQSVAHLRKAGIEATGVVGAADPIVAVSDVWDPTTFDEIIVSTLPMRFSKWLHAGLPERIGKLTDAPVTHIVSQPPKPPIEVAPAPPHQEEPLGPLSVLGWGAPKDQ